MSVVDTTLDPVYRKALIDELRSSLAAFLSPATSAVTDPLASLGDLTNLRRRDLRRLVRVHMALSPTVRAFVSGLGSAMRSPISDTERLRYSGQSVQGSIDWGATVRSRAATGNPVLYVTRPARRSFDTPENRALAWVLREIEVCLRDAMAEMAATTPAEGWVSDLSSMHRAVDRARSVHWLRGVPPEAPGAIGFERLAASRSLFYRDRTSKAAAALERVIGHPSVDDLIDMLLDTYFVPHRDWKLFEIAVAVRVAGRLGEVAQAREDSLLEGSGRRPFSRLRFPNGHIQLWYQRWPKDFLPSEHLETLTLHGVTAQPTQPDLVVEVIPNSVPVTALLLECKASTSPSYLSSGVSQALGYLKERPTLFLGRPVAAVVAPPSPAFHRPSGTVGTSAALVSDEDIADWVADLVIPRVA